MYGTLEIPVPVIALNSACIVTLLHTRARSQTLQPAAHISPVRGVSFLVSECLHLNMKSESTAAWRGSHSCGSQKRAAHSSPPVRHENVSSYSPTALNLREYENKYSAGARCDGEINFQDGRISRPTFAGLCYLTSKVIELQRAAEAITFHTTRNRNVNEHCNDKELEYFSGRSFSDALFNGTNVIGASLRGSPISLKRDTLSPGKVQS